MKHLALIFLLLLPSLAMADSSGYGAVPQSKCLECGCMVDSRIEMLRIYEHYYTKEPRFMFDELEDCKTLMAKVQSRLCQVQKKYNIWDWTPESWCKQFGYLK